MALTTDPVCQMTINADDAPDQSEYQGKTYHFCCRQCKEDFDEDPHHYATRLSANEP